MLIHYLVGILIEILLISGEDTSLKSYYNHPCLRDCNGYENMDCYYNFTLEYYEVLTRDCLECSMNVKKDCFRKYCIAANGISRTMKVVNRMLPGPSIQGLYCDCIELTEDLFFNYLSSLLFYKSMPR